MQRSTGTPIRPNRPAAGRQQAGRTDAKRICDPLKSLLGPSLVQAGPAWAKAPGGSRQQGGPHPCRGRPLPSKDAHPSAFVLMFWLTHSKGVDLRVKLTTKSDRWAERNRPLEVSRLFYDGNINPFNLFLTARLMRIKYRQQGENFTKCARFLSSSLPIGGIRFRDRLIRFT